jgi:hypothetical protein
LAQLLLNVQRHHRVNFPHGITRETDLKDNPFRGLADLAIQSVQMQWGRAVLVIAVAMLIAAAAMKDAANDWSR